MKYISIFIITILLTGALLTSCNKHVTEPPSTHCDTCGDTTHHACDTCNLNQDSLQRVKDSLAHAFVWTEYSIPGESNLTGVWVFGANDIIIVGNYLWHYDGVSFTQINARDDTHHSSLRGALSGYSIFASSRTDIWLVHGSDVLHSFDGVGFDDYRPGNANACWGTSSQDMFVVGNAGQIHHYDGTSFTDMVSPTTKDLRKVWGTSNKDVWAGGLNRSTGVSCLLHYDGIKWTEIPLSDLGQFGCANCDGVSAVWTIDSASHHKVYVGGSYLYRKTDNSLWTNDGDSVGNKFNDGSYAGITTIRGNSATDILCTSDWGFASHWNGKTWKRYDELYDPNSFNYYTNSMSFNGSTACIVGVRGGTSWVAIGRRGK